MGVMEDVSFTVDPSDLVDGTTVRLRFQANSDNNTSSEDCLAGPFDGAAQIDNIAVTFDQGDGELPMGGVETFEPGHPTAWQPTLGSGVGDFAQVWPVLEQVGRPRRERHAALGFHRRWGGGSGTARL